MSPRRVRNRNDPPGGPAGRRRCGGRRRVRPGRRPSSVVSSASAACLFRDDRVARSASAISASTSAIVGFDHGGLRDFLGSLGRDSRRSAIDLGGGLLEGGLVGGDRILDLLDRRSAAAASSASSATARPPRRPRRCPRRRRRRSRRSRRRHRRAGSISVRRPRLSSDRLVGGDGLDDLGDRLGGQGLLGDLDLGDGLDDLGLDRLGRVIFAASTSARPRRRASAVSGASAPSAAASCWRTWANAEASVLSIPPSGSWTASLIE